MKLLLFLLFPISGFCQSLITPITVGSGISLTPYTNQVVCARTHIDTIKKVDWFIEIRDSTMGPLSTKCNTCDFLHTWNDLTHESHWYEMYHRKSDEWAYYIHEVNVICLKQYGKPIIYPNR